MHQIGSYVPAQQKLLNFSEPGFVPNLGDSASGKGMTQASQAS